MNEQMTLRGTLRGQDGEITQIATNTEYPKMILSASRGKKSIIDTTKYVPNLKNFDFSWFNIRKKTEP